ncbi:NAD(P)/FAD-dependent oxidoreductase [Rubellicoccus peritrichatus]|uniref:FAD-dependent oxidoreductase n=1 Tax=Rubellicoccus peritrichatus TaxID=3080537 RepID=A0AAQ3LCT1_9BACT|nr:FAD-dependent oxidoreductase [Puniceicoccus sp. CR14]WOO42097.1 FAD-dependent oxidoreductase [Puniceicoccus sp. CR14]
MKISEHTTDILIVGAGLSGLAAASELKKQGRDVLVIDKGRGVGGRLANRRIGKATFDHGAQFMTVRNSRFAELIKQWVSAGVAEEWYCGSVDGHSRWRGKPAMTGIAKQLADGLNLLLGKRIASLRQDENEPRWIAELEDGECITANAVLMTPPVPQTLTILDEGGVELAADIRAYLETIQYERCFAVMAVLDGPSRVPSPGNFSPEEGPVAWIADNQMKGVSELPAVTIHARADFSMDNWERDRQEVARELIEAAGPWLGSSVIEFQVHGWRYSKPLRVENERCYTVSKSPALVLAGDAFGGQRVEGAVLSGWAAADVLK